MADKKVLTTETFNGITFRNFPAEEYMNDLYFSMHDESLAETIAEWIHQSIPESYQVGIEIDCLKIQAFHQEEKEEEPTSEAEKRILVWLNEMFPQS